MVIINATSLHIQTQRELRKNFKKSIKVDLKKKKCHNLRICFNKNNNFLIVIYED